MVEDELRKLRDENKGLKLWLIALLFLLVIGAVSTGLLTSKAASEASSNGFREGYQEGYHDGYEDALNGRDYNG